MGIFVSSVGGEEASLALKKRVGVELVRNALACCRHLRSPRDVTISIYGMSRVGRWLSYSLGAVEIMTAKYIHGV